jgi:hypothetical protein
MKNDCIQGPCEGMAHAGVSDVESYRKVHQQALVGHGKSVEENKDPQAAYINHGRWVVDCPKCNGAGLTSRTMKVSCCFDCGGVFINITFPKQAKKIEDVLLKRTDMASRNWTTESVNDLLEENKTHGVSDGVDHT